MVTSKYFTKKSSFFDAHKKIKDYKNLNATKLFRFYKNSPHNPESLFLKYAIHRIENRDLYAKSNAKDRNKLDTNFLNLHKLGDANKKMDI